MPPDPLPDGKIVTVPVTEREIARRWLYENNLVAIEWSAINRIVESEVARDMLVYDPANYLYRGWPQEK
jgi:hypothetical protein